ncbi:uncharacterized protein BX664DRAFT_326165 [Halteromyces radiatus]|uniref:uncharacterized protein n=1 Tax=Halteromyces radiatus TaxID=101107 RepID=UPI00222122AC|nr:uncharacterized protein BX664DRAFT_326165 [Halteromyces radiatus]KAI8097345.1 hypothetical protein BX664DRAFT_326165 [Halteromyces radiatus]
MAHREGITTETHDWTMIKASTLIENQKVIEIDGNTPVEQACNILIDNNISSAPVYTISDTTTQQKTNSSMHSGKTYNGFFDYADVIAYILLILKSTTVEESGSLEIRDIVKKALQGKQVPVSLASDLSQKNPFYSILPEATLISAVEEFSCGTHRVCVLNPDGQIKGILSQSTVVKYLYENKHQFPSIDSLLNKTLRQLNLGQTDVISVSADSPVLDALSQMSTYGVSSVAVLGHMGVILGNISMTDVKHVLKSYQHRLLWDTCFQFVSLVRTQQGIDDGQDRLPVFDVRLDTTLGFSIAKLLATKSHRVWVTDERDRAIGVVSLTDVMMAITSMANAS